MSEKYRVRLTEVATGKTVEYEEEVEWTDSSEYWWTDGNMSCDCNRKGHFYGMQGIDLPPEATPCGEGAYLATAIFADGSELDLNESTL